MQTIRYAVSDVNKDWMCKDEDKDKDQAFKDRTRTRIRLARTGTLKMQDWNLEDNFAGPHILIFFSLLGHLQREYSRPHDGQATS